MELQFESEQLVSHATRDSKALGHDLGAIGRLKNAMVIQIQLKRLQLQQLMNRL